MRELAGLLPQLLRHLRPPNAAAAAARGGRNKEKAARKGLRVSKGFLGL